MFDTELMSKFLCSRLKNAFRDKTLLVADLSKNRPKTADCWREF